jgi:predicted regulator of Ras-like GTPase activity (Roadblock/LC7/MglB family)
MSEQDLGFLLEDLRSRMPQVVRVVALSGDGMLIAASAGMPRDVAERLAAATSGLVSLLRVVGQELGTGAVSHTVCSFEGGHTVVMAVDHGALVALAENDSDLGAVSYELADLVNRVAHVLIPQARGGLPAMAASAPCR